VARPITFIRRDPRHRRHPSRSSPDRIVRGLHPGAPDASPRSAPQQPDPSDVCSPHAVRSSTGSANPRGSMATRRSATTVPTASTTATSWVVVGPVDPTEQVGPEQLSPSPAMDGTRVTGARSRQRLKASYERELRPRPRRRVDQVVPLLAGVVRRSRFPSPSSSASTGFTPTSGENDSTAALSNLTARRPHGVQGSPCCGCHECWHNPRRRRSNCGMLRPADHLPVR
jgi:hypothetical protein